MRTENNPTNIIQSSTLSAKVQDLSLANQLFSVGDNSQSFNDILSSQVQPSREAASPRPDSDSSARCQGAKQRPDSGNGLPDDKRLEKQQRADRDKRDVRAEDRREDDRRVEHHRETKNDRSIAAAEEVRDDQVRADQLSEDQLQGEAKLDESQSESCQCDDHVDSEALESGSTIELVESGVDIAADSELKSTDDQILQSALVDADNVTDESAETTQVDAGDKIESVQADELLASDEEDPLEAGSDDPDDVPHSENEVPQHSLEAMEEATENSDPEVQVALNNESNAIQPEPAKSGAVADEAKTVRDGATAASSSMPTGREQQNGSNKLAADGQPATNQSSSESQEMPVFEPKADKKSELGLLADKLAQKPASGEGLVPTPVQERLAALAKALDKVGSSNSSQPASKVTEQVDSVKATPFQRSLEQVGRAMTGAKPPIAIMQAPLQSREWGSEMAQRLVMMVSTKLNSAKIQLNPQEMGSIDVKVSVKHDQAHVVFTSQVAPTRDALEQAIPRLREMMEQNGVALGDVDVRDQDARESHEQRGQNQRQNARISDGGSTVEESASANTDAHVAVGIVDYYA